MMEPPNEATIQQLLVELQSGEAYRRTGAAETIKIRKILDERLTNALNNIALHDPNSIVRNMAKDALAALGLALGDLGVAKITDNPPVATTSSSKSGKQMSRNEKWRDFLIGFLGWYAVNVPIWLFLTNLYQSSNTSASSAPLSLSCLLFPVNVLVLVICAFTMRWVALGILTSYAANFLLAMMLGLMFQAACWIPFFIK
jgi:hypothetical protein